MQFLLDPYIPLAQVHVLAGSSGTGKTTILSQALTADLPWGKVLYVATDRTEDSILALWRTLDLTLPHVTTYSLVDEIASKLKKNPAALHSPEGSSALFSLQAISRLSAGFNTLILDPAAPLMPLKNFNDTGQVARAMCHLAAWAKNQSLTIILVFHTNKTKKDGDFMNPFNRISGSHALLGYASTKALLLSKDEHEDGPALLIQGQHFPEKTFLLERTAGPTLRILSDSEVSAKGLLDGLGGIIDKLPPVAFTPLELQDLLGMSKASVHRYLDKLLQAGVIEKTEHGKYRKIVRPVS